MSIICKRAHPEYPFQDLGDNTTVIWRVECECEVSDYVMLTQGTNVFTQASAGLTGVPADYYDSNCRYCHDTNFNYARQTRMTFTRVFAKIPLDRDDTINMQVDMPKHLESVSGGLNTIFRGGPTYMAASVEYRYVVGKANVTQSPKFKIIYNGFETDYVRDGSFATTPDASTFYADTEVVAELTDVQHWLGDIYVGITKKINPSDIYTP